VGLMGKLSGICAALVLSASSAAAVTVTVAHTATVDYIHDEQDSLTVKPVAGQTIRAGDTYIFKYSLDLSATGGTTYCDDCRQFNLQSASVSFSSGFSANLTDQSLVVWASPYADLDGTFGLSYEIRDAGFVGSLGAYMAGSGVSRLSGPYSPDLASFVSEFDNMPVQYGRYNVNPGAIGASANDCYGEYCFVAMTNWNGEISAGNTQPSTPSVTPVPVPAPFLMLGMAMLGLIGFGRRARS